MIDPHAYGIEVRRRIIDDETVFEARVRELPDIAEYADTFDEAYALALDTIATTATLFAERGRTMPDPLVPVDEWSGRVTLRLPKSLHRALAEAAEREDCSLNQHIVNVLGYFTGYAHAERAAGAHWQAAEATHLASAGEQRLRLVSSSQYSESFVYRAA